jgi:hypothetical protein
MLTLSDLLDPDQLMSLDALYVVHCEYFEAYGVIPVPGDSGVILFLSF